MKVIEYRFNARRDAWVNECHQSHARINEKRDFIESKRIDISEITSIERDCTVEKEKC